MICPWLCKIWRWSNTHDVEIFRKRFNQWQSNASSVFLEWLLCFSFIIFSFNQSQSITFFFVELKNNEDFQPASCCFFPFSICNFVRTIYRIYGFSIWIIANLWAPAQWYCYYQNCIICKNKREKSDCFRVFAAEGKKGPAFVNVRVRVVEKHILFFNERKESLCIPFIRIITHISMLIKCNSN